MPMRTRTGRALCGSAGSEMLWVSGQGSGIGTPPSPSYGTQSTVIAPSAIETPIAASVKNCSSWVPAATLIPTSVEQSSSLLALASSSLNRSEPAMTTPVQVMKELADLDPTLYGGIGTGEEVGAGVDQQNPGGGCRDGHGHQPRTAPLPSGRFVDPTWAARGNDPVLGNVAADSAAAVA